ncbi:MAG: hypothetical protein U0169_03280 [Polyangiaceae bacterium]
MTTKTINSWDWDVRVRERNLKNGTLDVKDVEKYVSALPDVAAQAEAMPLPQPALDLPDDEDDDLDTDDAAAPAADASMNGASS